MALQSSNIQSVIVSFHPPLEEEVMKRHLRARVLGSLPLPLIENRDTDLAAVGFVSMLGNRRGCDRG